MDQIKIQYFEIPLFLVLDLMFRDTLQKKWNCAVKNVYSCCARASSAAVRADYFSHPVKMKSKLDRNIKVVPDIKTKHKKV